MAKKKKTYIAKVLIKGDRRRMPDFGLGKGVLFKAELECIDKRNKGFNSLEFACSRMEQEERLINEAVEVKWEEVRA